MDIGKIDKNLQIEATVNEPDIVFYDIRDTQATLHGLHDPRTPGEFRRMPEAVANQISAGVDQQSLAGLRATMRIRGDTCIGYTSQSRTPRHKNGKRISLWSGLPAV